MRHQWYADGRDLIKWGVLLHLAEYSGSQRIIQVAFLRPDNPYPRIERRYGESRKELALPDIVWSHFTRRLDDIRRLERETGIEILLMDENFHSEARHEYSMKVIKEYQVKPRKSTILFLDPDTGLAGKHPKPEHVTAWEVSKYWKALEPSDWLVLYQHSNHDKNWLSNKEKEFSASIGATVGVEVFRATSGAKDVAFICARKQ